MILPLEKAKKQTKSSSLNIKLVKKIRPLSIKLPQITDFVNKFEKTKNYYLCNQR